MKISQRCVCGAEFGLDIDSTTTEKDYYKEYEDWKSEHQDCLKIKYTKE